MNRHQKDRFVELTVGTSRFWALAQSSTCKMLFPEKWPMKLFTSLYIFKPSLYNAWTWQVCCFWDIRPMPKRPEFSAAQTCCMNWSCQETTVAMKTSHGSWLIPRFMRSSFTNEIMIDYPGGKLQRNFDRRRTSPRRPDALTWGESLLCGHDVFFSETMR